MPPHFQGAASPRKGHSPPVLSLPTLFSPYCGRRAKDLAMTKPRPRKTLPPNPNLEHLRKQAKKLAKETPESSLTEIQRQMANDYGYPNWAELSAHVSKREKSSQVLADYYEVQRRAIDGTGEPAALLKELLAFFDTRMREFPTLVGVRCSFVLTAILRLGKAYPPAIEALRVRQARARASLSTREGWSDYRGLCWVFKEFPALVEAHDQAKAAGAFTPPKRSMFEAFLEVKRYKDAASAWPVGAFLTDFDRDEAQGPHAIPAELKTRHLVSKAGQALEAYAGMDDLAGARAVIGRVLRHARTAEVIELLRGHAARAGHPELLDGIGPG